MEIEMQLQANKNFLDRTRFKDIINPEEWKRGTHMKKTQFKQILILFYNIIWDWA
jgi:hypothetical protein